MFGETKKFTRIVVVVGLAMLAILGLGTCVVSYSKLTKSASEMQITSRDFIDDMFANGIPKATNPIWARGSQVTEKRLMSIRSLLDFYNKVERFGETNCNFQSIMRAFGPSGTFVTCATPVEYSQTKGQIIIVWKREAEDWKILHLITLYQDMSAYYKAEARKEIFVEIVPDPVLPEIEIAGD